MTAFEPGLAGGEGRGNPCEGTELPVERMVNTNPWGTSARVWRAGTVEARVGETGGELLREQEHRASHAFAGTSVSTWREGASGLRLQDPSGYQVEKRMKYCMSE